MTMFLLSTVFISHYLWVECVLERHGTGQVVWQYRCGLWWTVLVAVLGLGRVMCNV